MTPTAVSIVFFLGVVAALPQQQQQQQQQQFQSRNTYDLANRGAYLPLGESQLAALENSGGGGGGGGVVTAIRNNNNGPQQQQQQLQDSYVVAKHQQPQQQPSSSSGDFYQGERLPGEYSSALDSYAAYNNYRHGN